jgi:outer membrane biosynthesis protein TonB
MGGSMASWAMLGDICIAEPKALLGFAGPVVVQNTIKKVLPEGFQRSEFVLDHGFLDAIVPRAELRTWIARTLDYVVADSFGLARAGEHKARLIRAANALVAEAEAAAAREVAATPPPSPAPAPAPAPAPVAEPEPEPAATPAKKVSKRAPAKKKAAPKSAKAAPKTSSKASSKASKKSGKKKAAGKKKKSARKPKKPASDA